MPNLLERYVVFIESIHDDLERSVANDDYIRQYYKVRLTLQTNYFIQYNKALERELPHVKTKFFQIIDSVSSTRCM